MANKTQLTAQLNKIAALSNQATNREQAAKLGKDCFLHLDYASCYGGYRVVNVKIGSGAHYGAFGGNGCESRLSAAKMAIKLDGILQGLQL